MTRRQFVNKGVLLVPAFGIFVPKLIRAATPLQFQPVYTKRTPVSGGYTAGAATFAGDNQCWLELDGTDSASDSHFFTFSCWYNPGTDDTASRVIFCTNDHIRILRGGGDNSIRCKVQNSSGTDLVEIRQDTGVVGSLISTSGWTWIAICITTETAGASFMYMANLATTWVATNCTSVITDTGASGNIDWTDSEFCVGDNNGGGSSPVNGCLSELYVDITQIRNFGSGAIRDVFYNSATHHPAGDLTSYGSPIFYLNGSGTGFNVNSGNGGNFVKKGTTALSSCTGP